MNSIISSSVNIYASTLTANKEMAKGNGKDIVTIYVTPKGRGGDLLALNMPAGVEPAVDVNASEGVISNVRFVPSIGAVLANLTCDKVTTSVVTAKINGKVLSYLDNSGNIQSQQLNIRFVADLDSLPKRRVVRRPGKGFDSFIQR